MELGIGVLFMKFKSKHLLMGVAALLFIIALFVAASLVAGLVGDFAFGKMLYAVYGFSSFLIPVFFFVAAWLCIDDKWSLQRIVCLAISFIPFFTLAIAENVSRKVYIEDIGPIAITKIIILMAIAVLLVAMEYLVAMVLSTSSIKKDVMPQVLKYKKIIVEKIQFTMARFTNKSKVTVSAAESVLHEDATNDTESDIQERDDVMQQEEDPALDDAEGDEAFEQNAYVEELVPKEPVPEEPASEDASAVEKTPEELEIERQIERNIDAAVDSMFEDDVSSEKLSSELDSDESMDAEREGYLSASDYTVESDAEVLSQQSGNTMELPSVHEVFEQMENDVNKEMQSAQEDKSIMIEDLEENLDAEEEFIEESDETSEVETSEDESIMEESVLNEIVSSETDEESSGDEDSFGSDSIADPYEIIDDEEPMTEDESSKEDASEEYTSDEDNAAGEDTSSEEDEADEVFVSDDDAELEEQTDEMSIEEGSESAETESVSYADMPRAVQSDGTPIPLPPKRRSGSPYAVSTDLLTAYEDNHYWVIDEETEHASQSLTETLNEFGIKAEITGIIKGPVVTMFEMLPAPGVKLSKIVALQDNIALRLAASSVRIVAPIPGKNAVGIEIPNAQRAIVSFKECIEQDLPEWKKMAVPVILGKDIEGKPQIMDLVKTPHLLIAGSTGAGKSVCVNSMLMSILYKRSPDQVKLILIDPKIVELKLYNDIPHLLTPVITEPKKAMQALQYCLCEMERRYALLDGMGVRDISSYNKRIVDRRIAAEKLPYLIVVIDEFADLMATTGKQLETVVARLCAMSRAVGIHLVLATQRPSIDVITGLIKANIPSRIAFMVASKTDSRIIIDQVGAEKLLGKGDMLYASSTDPFPVRIQGTFVSDQEVENVVESVKQWGEPEYIDDEIFVPDDDDDDDGQVSLMGDGGEDPLYEKALDIVVQAGKASASYIQRRLKIGYNRAARLVEEMEERGIVGPANGSKPREIIHMP